MLNNSQTERQIAAMLLCEVTGRSLDAGKYSEALDAAERALAADSTHPQPWIMRGRVHQEAWEHAAAHRCFYEALRLDPLNPAAWNNVFFTELYSAADPRALHAMHVDWSIANRANVYTRRPVRKRLLKVGGFRRIRVGFQSADFCAHPVGRFIFPLLALMNRKRFEVRCYHVGKVDDATNRIAGVSDFWHWEPVASGDGLRDRMREDDLDVCFDLAGHTYGNRLLECFAPRVAPVQISYLGYPHSTHVANMDYRLASDYTDAPDTLGTESLMRLPGPFLACMPLDFFVRELGASEERFTFGSFNRTHKLTADQIALWVSCLNAVPGSTMLLKARGFESAQLRHKARSDFAACGLRDVSRVSCVPIIESPERHMDAWNRVAVALDTYPYSGTTTTFDALQMGVPVVTMAGPLHVSRVSACLLDALGWRDQIAPAGDGFEYVRIAARLARETTTDAKRLRASFFQRWLTQYVPRLVRGIESEVWDALMQR